MIDEAHKRQKIESPQRQSDLFGEQAKQLREVLHRTTGMSANVLLVTITKVESRAVMQLFEEATGQLARPQPIAGSIYHNLGQVNGAHIFMALSEMGAGGIGAALQTVQKGIKALAPLAVIMVGIAFGINQQKQAIGDILVSQQLWLYDLQRVGQAAIIPRGDKPHASSRLLNYLRSGDLYWDDSRGKVSFGLILTGDKLVDNVDYRDQLRQFEQEAIGGEMEGAGLYVACQDAHVDWILVKGICDWGNGQKEQDTVQHEQLAARNAVAFVLHTLQQTPIIDEAELLNDAVSILHERIRGLRREVNRETNPKIKAKLEKDLKQAKADRETVEEHLAYLE
jgi:nucleoside phosphorylase